MDLRFFVARKERKEIYSMETIINIFLAPWTLFEWIFSLVIWYIVISLISRKFYDYGIDRYAVQDWAEHTWDTLKDALKLRRDK